MDTLWFFCVCMFVLPFLSKDCVGDKRAYIQLEEPMKNQTRMAGKAAKLKCMVTGYPRPEFTWSKDGRTFSAGTKTIKRGSRLLLRSLKVTDSGHYECRARNSHGAVSTSASLVVNRDRAEPHFEGADSPVTVSVVVGETAILPCIVHNFEDKYMVFWTDAINTLLSIKEIRIVDDRRISIERTSKSDWNLKIRKVTHSDQGSYTCQINTDPVQSKVVTLKIEEYQDKMKPSVIATNTQLFPGVMLRCEFPDSDSSMTFEWTINGRPMYPDDSFNISFTQNSTTLNIFRLSGVVYDLVYTCAVISVEDGRVITEANFIWTDMFSDQCRENLPPLCTKYGWSAYVPSYLKPQNIDDAALQLHLFFPLVKIGCSAALHPFLCYLYAPPCSDALRLPCRSLCLEARQGCDPVMTKFGYNWPVLFDCMTFPEDNCWSSYNNLTGEPVVSKSHEPMLTTNVPTTIAMSTETQEQSTEVNRPPGIFIQPEKDVYFNPNVTVQLPCVATGFPKPTYKWKFNGWDLNPNGQDDRVVQLPDEGTIEINAPGNKDEGLYQCFADNGYGVSVSIKSHLREAELGNFVFEDSRTHILYIVDSLMLPCTTPTSYPTPDVYWVFRDRDGLWKPLNYGKRITMDLEGRLRFANIKKSDVEKVYACRVINNILRSQKQGPEHYIELKAASEQKYPAREFWASPSDHFALKGDQLKLKCIFAGNPTPDVSWTKIEGTKRVELPPYSKVTEFGMTLEINNITREDMGLYECMGLNTETVRRPVKSFWVRVESAPYWINEPEDTEKRIGETVTFICRAGGIPEPSYFWYINGVPLRDVQDPRIFKNSRFMKPDQNTITITNLTPEDHLNVQCNATNKHGYKFSDVYLNVIGGCVNNSIPMCKDLGYRSVYMPANQNQTIDDVGLKIHQFYPLVKVQCSRALKPFLCYKYAPPCSEPRSPCKSLCEEARMGCRVIMNKFGFRWPDFLDCTTLPEKDCLSPFNNTYLLGPTSTVSAPITNGTYTMISPATTNTSSTKVSGNCVNNSIPMCKDLGYSSVYMPANQNKSIDDVGLTIHQFFPLVEVQCSRALKPLLCYKLAPPCSEPRSPCRSLCEEARIGCGPIMNKFGFRWPDYLDCTRLPEKDCLSPFNNTYLFGPTVSTSKSNATYTMMSAATTNMPLAEVSGFCVVNQIPMCKDLGYNSIFLPNNLNQTIEDVGLGLSEFGPLVAVQCSRALKPFLCYKFAPPCTEPRSPCRRLCEEARMGCESLMKKFGFRWPDHLGCTSLPEKDCLSQYPNDNGYPSTSDNSTHLFDLFDKLQRQPSNTSYSSTTKITPRTTQMPQTKVESMRSGGVILIRSNSSAYMRYYAFGNIIYKPVTTDLYVNPRNFDIVRMEGLRTHGKCPREMTECYILEFRRFSESENQPYAELTLAFSHVDEFNNAKNQL